MPTPLTLMQLWTVIRPWADMRLYDGGHAIIRPRLNPSNRVHVFHWTDGTIRAVVHANQRRLATTADILSIVRKGVNN